LEPFAKAVDEPMKDIRMKYAIKDQLDNYIEAVDDNGNAVPNTIQIPNDKIAIVNKDMDELLSQMVEVLNVKFKLSEFPDTLELQPAVLVGLTPLITEDEPTELSLVK
jgi:translation initiation factor 6 (eIF-6)